MYQLSIIKHKGVSYIDSREVAVAIGKEHCHLLRDIRKYIEIMSRNGLSKIGLSDFFVESSYSNIQKKQMPCYYVSKVGCDLIANKLTGEKGIMFTCAYVTKFREMEDAERSKESATQPPRLGEYNAAARLIVRALQNSGGTAEQVVDFLKSVYEPLGFTVAHDDLKDVPQFYTAKQIAKMHGVYSLTGNPHPQAVAAILNDNLFIDDSHKSVVTVDYGSHVGLSVKYDEYAVQAVKDWIIENGCPGEIWGNGRVYHVLYDFQLKRR